MKIELKWHEFLCRVFGHRWHYHEKDIGQHYPEQWLICKRCAKAKPLEPRSGTLNCLCTFIPPEPSKEELEFIEFHKTNAEQIEKYFGYRIKTKKPKGELYD